MRLRAVDPKPIYKPGETIVLELRCAPGVEDVRIQYNPTQDPADEGIAWMYDEPKCPVSRVELPIPRDFIGKNRVTIRMPDSDKLLARFEFEVRSDELPRDLWFSTDSQNEGCDFSYLRDRGGEPPRVGLFAVVEDGTRFDICREKKVVFAAVPPENALAAREDGLCLLTLKKPGPLKVVATYRGLRKEWTCFESRPDVEHFRTRGDTTTHPPPRISVEEFLQDPGRLDRNPMDVGTCRLLQHWDTGYCYVYNLSQGRKVSEHTDARCTELDELRRRMALAIEQGHCAGPGQDTGRRPAS